MDQVFETFGKNFYLPAHVRDYMTVSQNLVWSSENIDVCSKNKCL